MSLGGRVDVPGGDKGHGVERLSGCWLVERGDSSGWLGGLGSVGEPPFLLPSRLRLFFASRVTTCNSSLVAACSSDSQAVYPGSVLPLAS